MVLSAFETKFHENNAIIDDRGTVIFFFEDEEEFNHLRNELVVGYEIDETKTTVYVVPDGMIMAIELDIDNELKIMEWINAK